LPPLVGEKLLDGREEHFWSLGMWEVSRPGHHHHARSNLTKCHGPLCLASPAKQGGLDDCMVDEHYRGWLLRDRLEFLGFDARLAGVPPALLEALWEV
jgi:hypothetical protein